MSDEQKLLAACMDYRAKLDALERENAALRDSRCTTWHLEKLLAENAALRVALEDIMTETDEQVIWRMARAALERKEAQP